MRHEGVSGSSALPLTPPPLLSHPLTAPPASPGRGSGRPTSTSPAPAARTTPPPRRPRPSRQTALLPLPRSPRSLRRAVCPVPLLHTARTCDTGDRDGIASTISLAVVTYYMCPNAPSGEIVLKNNTK